MKKIEYIVKDPLGIHARPAGLLVKQMSSYQSNISINCGGKTGDAKKIFAIMGLSIKCGDNIEVIIDGPDEAEAATAIEKFLSENI